MGIRRMFTSDPLRRWTISWWPSHSFDTSYVLQRCFKSHRTRDLIPTGSQSAEFQRILQRGECPAPMPTDVWMHISTWLPLHSIPAFGAVNMGLAALTLQVLCCMCAATGHLEHALANDVAQGDTRHPQLPPGG